MHAGTFTACENPKFGSFLGASADIDFYHLDDTSGTKDVRIQVKALPLQNMTLEQYTNIQINSTEGQI
jgi:hypothetical protein